MARRERQIDPDGGALARFAVDLRMLREGAGRPTYRQLAARTGYSVTALAEAAGGQRLPSLPVTLAFVAVCSGDQTVWRQRWQQVADELNVVAAADRDGAWPVPRQLPSIGSYFVGRTRELRRIDELTRDEAVSVVVITGAPGVGKTATAVHWARAVVARFPDGQLYANLRGFDPSGHPVPPNEAIRRFLDAFGLPPERIPADLDAQACLYRSLLSNRRVLVVLDNAASAEQVRPLLPGSSRCLAVITSRSELGGLVVGDGAHPVCLDVPTAAEAGLLLERRIGGGRVAVEPRAIAQIVSSCGRLPLALAIVAARAANHPAHALGRLAGELAEAHGRLDAFHGDDPATDVRTVFSWSYRTLGRPAARMFRLLGMTPGPDLTEAAAASLAGLPAEQVRPLFAELTRAHLLTEHAAGRFALHDLLYTYAFELVGNRAEGHCAAHRLLDHYLHSAHSAARLLDPHWKPLAIAPARLRVVAETFGDHDQALAWFTAERSVLMACVAMAERMGRDEHTWHLASALAIFLDRNARWHDRSVTQQAALAATTRLGDVAGQASAHRGLARAHARLGRHDAALAHYRHAFRLFAELGDRTGQAHTHLNLAWMFGQQGDHGKALDHAGQAHDLYLAAGDRSGRARALNNSGWYHARLGDYPKALSCCRDALDLQQEIGDEHGAAATWDTLGYAHHRLGCHPQAIDCYEKALHNCRRTGDRCSEAETLIHLADAHAAAGDQAAGHDARQRAIEILGDLGAGGPRADVALVT